MRGALSTMLALVLTSGAPQAGAQQPATAPQTRLQAIDPAVIEAEHLMQENHLPEAETILRNELTAHARDADAHYALAFCLLHEDHPADALRQYTAAAAIRPPSSSELVNVGQAYVLLKDDPDADKWTLQAVRMDPKNPLAWYSLGRIRYTDQKFAEAAACFRKTLELSPHNVKAENNLGLAYEAQNRTDDAVTAYRQAIAWQTALPASQRSEQPLLNLAIVLLHRGDTSSAEPLLTQAVTIAPNDPHIHEQLGHLYLQEADFASAAKQFQQATSEDPKNSGLHFLLGQAYRHLGNTEAANAEFSLASQLTASHSTPIR